MPPATRAGKAGGKLAVASSITSSAIEDVFDDGLDRRTVEAMGGHRVEVPTPHVLHEVVPVFPRDCHGQLGPVPWVDTAALESGGLENRVPTRPRNRVRFQSLARHCVAILTARRVNAAHAAACCVSAQGTATWAP